MKKTDEEHPFNKRMKLESEQEQEIYNQKENSMSLSNRQLDSKPNLQKYEEEKQHLQAAFKKDPSMSFKMSIGDLNSFEDKSIKLRRCETEKLHNLHPSLDDEDSPQTFDTPEDMMNEIVRLRSENDKLKNVLNDKEKGITEKHKKLELKEHKLYEYTQISEKMEKSIRELERKLTISQSKKLIIKEALIKYIVKCEDQLKKEKSLWVKEQLHRLGRYTFQRYGTQFKKDWEDGEDFKKLSTEMGLLNDERERIEKQKKSIKAKRRQEGGCEDGSDESIPKNDTEYQQKLDQKEEREILLFKLSLNQKCMQNLQEKFNSLRKDKILFQEELTRINEEESSKYCGKAKENPYKILNSQYLVLSLLGRGGYSEVYKAYDLDNCREVACKIHHFDNNWTENLKASYIKHALRENQTHRELNHPRVVRQYDTVEIDNNSFCTVLELCSGPDLHMYLKQHGVLPEKEAKLIISQILSGLKYLNDREKKIIHYDLKPQNILFHKGEIKISDFGLCKELERDKDKIELTSQGVGTYWYQPPECFEEGPHPAMISSKVDVWSVGVIFYEMLYGKRPFGDDQSQKKILIEKTIINDAKQVHFPAKPAVSNETKEFIQSLLSYKHEDRLSVEKAYFEIMK